MSHKKIHQLVDENGKATAHARSAPAWFVSDTADVQVKNLAQAADGEGTMQWGKLFSQPHKGNSVEFFTTGEDYFKRVAAAISGAKSSVFIAGWQVNYDVRLVGSKTLFDCLQDAMKGGATVYVMPWFSPKVGVDTGDFETLLAVSHLNAANAGAPAYCLPSIQQGDQGTLGTFFAHHQKLVVIDNEVAFAGGIDLAYGRRDDANLSLKANGRVMSELYSSCIPPIHKLSNVEMENCVTRAELIAAALTDGWVKGVSTFFTSPSEGALAKTLDVKDEAVEGYESIKNRISDEWDNLSILPDVLKDLPQKARGVALDVAQDASMWAWHKLDPAVRGRVDKLRDTASGNAANAAAAVIAWLHNGDLSRLPPDLMSDVSVIIDALTYGVVAGMPASIKAREKRYDRLFEKITMVPKSGKSADPATQPRMPWHDVHSRIEGPSVYDLARNFTRRWNATAQVYEQSFSKARLPIAQALLTHCGIKLPPTPTAPRIDPKHAPTLKLASKGSNWVQVLRSAPMHLQSDEASAAGEKTPVTHAQNNCLKAMLKVIGSSQKFIYIENQFFQSAHGDDNVADPALSGPLAALLDIRSSPDYKKFAEMLGIAGVPVGQIPSKLRWSKVEAVEKLVRGPEFISQLKTTLTNLATIEFMRLMAKPQTALKNPIAQALVNRIERAINDGLPFHVYMVLPVHPEGTLNTINIMTQVHLTMQTLVFGEHSLVNGVRRAIVTAKYRKDARLGPAEARAKAAALSSADLSREAGDAWKQYLTLLNLRNWTTLGGKPVTEQIYVHSKLLIADDRVAILGSANINDRSQWGDRDSELAVVITDDSSVDAKLDGVHTEKVAKSIQKLRLDLWHKLFGLGSSDRQAAALNSPSLLQSPASSETWKMIQKVADGNAEAYERSFAFIPRNGALPSIQPKDPQDKSPSAVPASIWPTWQYTKYSRHQDGGHLMFRMPFDELFWRAPQHADQVASWNVAKGQADAMAPTHPPAAGAIHGFIVSLPVDWTWRENNQSGMNLTVLAGIWNRGRSPDGLEVAERSDEGKTASSAS